MARRAVSLLEILVSVLVLSLIMTGTLNVFISSRNRSAITTKQNIAAEAAKGLLDSLQMDVDQSRWAAGCIGGGTCPSSALTVGTLVITPSWDAPVNIGGTEPVYKMRVTVTYLAPH
jgi:type II secretory pathway pseudopilin PulG